MKITPVFNPPIIGYIIEYYLQTPNGKKFVASKIIDKPDREVLGYYGTKCHTATEDIFINGSKKIITKGSTYYTRLVQLNGRDKKFYNNLIECFGNVRTE